ATLARVLLPVERPGDAVRYAEHAYEQLQQLELALEGESLTRLAYAEALWGCGRTPEALRAIEDARVDLLERADRLGAADARHAFLRYVPENVTILEHAQEWPEAAP